MTVGESTLGTIWLSGMCHHFDAWFLTQSIFFLSQDPGALAGKIRPLILSQSPLEPLEQLIRSLLEVKKLMLNMLDLKIILRKRWNQRMASPFLLLNIFLEKFVLKIILLTRRKFDPLSQCLHLQMSRWCLLSTPFKCVAYFLFSIFIWLTYILFFW